MSTPVTANTPPTVRRRHVRVPTAELKATMQRMIELQNEQQEQYQKENLDDPPHVTSQFPRNIPPVPYTPNSSMRPSAAYQPSPSLTSLTFVDPGVGKGTMTFGPDYDAFNQDLTGNNLPFLSPIIMPVNMPPPPVTNQLAPQQQQMHRLKPERPPRQSSSTSLTRSTQHLHLASYGTIDESNEQFEDAASLPGGHLDNDLQQNEFLQPNNDDLVHPNASADTELPLPPPPLPTPQVPKSYNYSNSLYEEETPKERSYRRSLSSCCCILTPIWHAAVRFWHADTLHRSFCYGAIDGMLTGSGIVSTFCGMNLVVASDSNSVMSSSSSRAVRQLVIAFSFATCLADSVCMAIGHIWTTYVVSVAQARDRRDAKQQLLSHTRLAKGLFVDMLLARGMLKIDAMSLADTLEGYPDLFVSVVMGESLVGTNSNNAMNAEANTVKIGEFSYVDGNSETTTGVGRFRHNSLADTIASPVSAVHSNSSLLHRAAVSYGRLGPNFEDDPDVHVVQRAVQEARRESFMMLLGFALFAVVPAIVFDLAVTFTNSSPATFTSAASYHEASGSVAAGMIHPNSLAISVCAIIMCCLGVWKSHLLLENNLDNSSNNNNNSFSNMNWLVTVESIIILLVCIAVAYSTGFVLTHCGWLPPFVLQVIDTEEKEFEEFNSWGT